MPDAFKDEVGGVHEDGCGWSPDGEFCGECSKPTCQHCPSWKETPRGVVMFYTKTYFCPPDCGGEEFDEWGYLPQCHRCSDKLEETRKSNYCPECGQRLDWVNLKYINKV